MARPREFDRDTALDKALRLFWAKGFAATSTDDLREAMGIGRQSLYGAFGDKRTLYTEALDTYQRRTNSGHLMRGGNQGEIRIASPKSVPKEQCRCLTRMFSIASLVVPEIQPLRSSIAR